MDSLGERVTRRWQQIDPLLPAAGPPPADCGLGLTVAGPGAEVVAAGSCEHWLGTPGSLDLTWGAARQFRLTAQVAGPGVGSPLDDLLTRWRDHLARCEGADDPDSAAIVTWPSRDVGGVAALRRHGLAPDAVIAARRARSDDAGTGPALAPDVLIRPATPADIDAIVSLGLEVVRFDGQVSSVTERASTAGALRRDCTELLAGPDALAVLAERDGAAIGMAIAEPPRRAAWLEPLTGLAPAAYLLLMGVQAGQRGAGVGAALAAGLHSASAAAGVEVMMLHYAQVNPLSVPFWSQQGYRPLWTVWEAQPASAVR